MELAVCLLNNAAASRQTLVAFAKYLQHVCVESRGSRPVNPKQTC